MAILGVDPENPTRTARQHNWRDSPSRKSGGSAFQFYRRRRSRGPMALEPIPETKRNTNQWSNAINCRSGGEQPCLCPEERATVRHGGSSDSRGCFPKPRILSGSSDAAVYIRKASGYFVWRDLPRAHWPSKRVHRRG